MIVPVVFGLVCLWVAAAWARLHFIYLFIAREGHATSADIRATLSARHARRIMFLTRASLPRPRWWWIFSWRRWQLWWSSVRPKHYAVPLGWARAPRRRIYGTPEDSYILLAPPRAGKTRIMRQFAKTAPGAFVYTSTRVGDIGDILAVRNGRGREWVWDPMGKGAGRSDFAWDPIEGCEEEEVALRRAALLLYGSRKDPNSGVEAFFKDAACDVLRAYLHAAALGGKRMVHVYKWSADSSNPDASEILRAKGANPMWIEALEAKQNSVQGTNTGVFMTVQQALAWMGHPGVQASVLPMPGQGFNAKTFLGGANTLLMLAEDAPGTPVAPFMVMFMDHLREVATQIGNTLPGRRMDPPPFLALDEVKNIVPVPLDSWFSDSGGRGITIAAAIQSWSQLADRWGPNNARTIWNAATFKLILGGDSDDDTLRMLSMLAGTHTAPRRRDQFSSQKTSFTVEAQSIATLTPDQISHLRFGRILVLAARRRPVITRFSPWPDRAQRVRVGCRRLYALVVRVRVKRARVSLVKETP